LHPSIWPTNFWAKPSPGAFSTVWPSPTATTRICAEPLCPPCRAAPNLLSETYGYDNASRLASVSDGYNNSAAYSYLANSPLVSQITFQSNSVTRMTTSKQYDNLNRLTQISSQPGGSGVMPVSFNYSYNNANQPIQDTLADGSYWIYGYDSLGQVTNGWRYWRDGTIVAGQQFDYLFDTIGNRTQTMSGGDSAGQNLRTANYSVQLPGGIGDAGSAGSIEVYAKDPCGGNFHITGLYSATLSGTGPVSGYGQAWLYSASHSTLSHIMASPQFPTAMGIAAISEDVALAPNTEKLVATYTVVLDLPAGGLTYVVADGSILMNQ
jgi:YD repeat-containing protein